MLDSVYLKKMANRCPLCGKTEEELNRLLIHCASIWGLWEELISIPSLPWAGPFLLKDRFFNWSMFPISKRKRIRAIILIEGKQHINRRLIKIKDNSIRQEKTYM